VVGVVGMTGPHLGAVDHPATLNPFGAGSNAGQIGTRIGLAHPDGEKQFATGDAGQVAVSLPLGAETKDGWARLAIGDPMRRDRGARGKEFFRSEKHFATGDAGQVAVSLPLGAETKDGWARLAIGDPMRRDRGARGKEFF